MWIAIFFLGIWGADVLKACVEKQKCATACKCASSATTNDCAVATNACIGGAVVTISEVEVLAMGAEGDGEKYCVSAHDEGFANNCTNTTHVCNTQATSLGGLCVGKADLKALSETVGHEEMVLDSVLKRCNPNNTTYAADWEDAGTDAHGDGALRCHTKGGKTSCICVQTAVCIQGEDVGKCVLAKTFNVMGTESPAAATAVAPKSLCGTVNTGPWKKAEITNGDAIACTTKSCLCKTGAFCDKSEDVNRCIKPPTIPLKHGEQEKLNYGCFVDDFNSTGLTDWKADSTAVDGGGALVCVTDTANKHGCICKKGAYCDLSGTASVQCRPGDEVLKHGDKVSGAPKKCFGGKTASYAASTTDSPEDCDDGETCNRSGVGKVCLKDEDMLGVNVQASSSSKLCFVLKTDNDSMVQNCSYTQSCNPHAAVVGDICLNTTLIKDDCPSQTNSTEYWHLATVAGYGLVQQLVKCGAANTRGAAPVAQSSATCEGKGETGCNGTKNASGKKACFWHSNTCQPLTCKNWAGTLNGTAFCTNGTTVDEKKECEGDENECTAAECCESDPASEPSKSAGDWIKNNTTIFVAMIVFGSVFLVVSCTCCWLMCNKGRGRELKSSLNNLFKKKDDSLPNNYGLRRRMSIPIEERSPSSPRDDARILLNEITSDYELPRRKKGNADANPQSDHGLLGSRPRNERNPLGPQSPRARNERSPLQPQSPCSPNERSPQSPRSPNERSPQSPRSPNERSPLRSRSPDEGSPLPPQSPSRKSPLDPTSKLKKKGKGKGKGDSGGRKGKGK